MTVQIPVPLGLVRTLLLVAVAWGGAAGIAVAFDHWLDDEGVAESELATIREQLSEVGGTTSPRLEGVLALLILNAAARGELRADVVRTQLFADASSSDYEACIDWLAGRAAEEIAGREACGRVAAAADFGP
jgi:hypothetical protein